jgi:SAM-dependent methyltransferase
VRTNPTPYGAAIFQRSVQFATPGHKPLNAVAYGKRGALVLRCSEDFGNFQFSFDGLVLDRTWRTALTDIDSRFYREMGAGGFTRFDGTIQFYGRVKSLIKANSTIVDLGAGRGSAALDEVEYRRDLVKLSGPGRHVIGVDVDDAVLSNPFVDEALVYDGGRLPLGDNSVDMIVSDHTLEHIDKPRVFAEEIYRVLKPGGWFCARTPSLFSALAIISSAIPNSMHVRILKYVQPDREAEDVFPTRYKLNTTSSIRKYFLTDKWNDYSHTWSTSPTYHFNNSVVYALTSIYQYIKKPFFGGEILHVFLRKKS